LQLDAILEILHGKRLVHSHSYRQDEIEMLMRVAEDFGFRIATFQHVLEGYKVADQMAKHGAGASTFSDWWAYKFEVYDAIPYNGALMHDATVVVSYNSDSDEQARRLNTEAAKAVKYGGVSQEEALKFVTLNPAKQLRIDNRVGSLEPGKDADFVIWSGSPLSTYSICEQTWVDGKKYFDRVDRKMNEEVQRERAVLIQKILAEKKPEGEKKPESPRPRRGYSCHEEDYGKEGY
jgi:N-acetylglucosamine-6-phosphate deacetylase